MTSPHPEAQQGNLERIRDQAKREALRVTQHAQQEMVEESITLAEVLEAIGTGRILEDYPEHRRGACCLVGGVNRAGRPIHAVVTTARPELIIITDYEPRPPKWPTPTARGRGADGMHT